MTKKKEIKPTLEIQKYIPQDYIEELKAFKEGDLYYYKSDDLFYLAQKINHKKEMVKVLVTIDGIDWRQDDEPLRHFKEYFMKMYLKEGESPSEFIKALRQEMKDRFNNQDTQWDDGIDDDDGEQDPEADTQTMGLTTRGTKETYQREAFDLLRMENKVKALSEMVKMRAERIYHEVRIIQKRLEKVMRVLGFLEIYLGRYEEVFQISQGTPADINEKISVRQQVLYMDEEAGLVKVLLDKNGTTSYGNINYAHIDLFDEWLLKKGNLDRVIPEKKGVVALRPSRNKSQYEGQDKWDKAEQEAADAMIYLLIRNGENVYRIWTSIKMDDTFFPTQMQAAEISKLFERANSDWDIERAEKENSVYFQNTMLIQGLIDRTDLFSPRPVGRINFADPATFEPGGMVRLIRDAENLLPNGRLSFPKWLDGLNSQVKRGTRIYVYRYERDYSDRRPSYHPQYWRRFDRYLFDEPRYPELTIYNVHEVIKGDHSTLYKILYKPTDEIYVRGEGYHDRKRGYSFRLYDSEFINYDDFTVEDIEYYLQARTERKHYWTMMPLLIGLRAKRIQELEKERQFAGLLAEKEGLPVDRVLTLLDWWKKKVINKRPLTSDDAKAWRMIIREAKKK